MNKTTATAETFNGSNALEVDTVLDAKRKQIALEDLKAKIISGQLTLDQAKQELKQIRGF